MLKTLKQCSNLIKILIDERELTLLNLKRLTDALIYKNTELVTSDGDLLLTVDSLITLNNIITGSNNLFLRSVNVKPAFYQKQYLDFTIIEFELYKLIDLFNDRYITNREFCQTFLNEIHPFLDGNGRTCKILFEDRFQYFVKRFVSDICLFTNFKANCIRCRLHC